MSSTSAFMRGEPTRDAVSRSTPYFSASRTCMKSADAGGFLLELFRLEIRAQGVHKGLKAAVHHIAELVQREADAMIGHAVLGEIIGADFFAAVAAAHHGAPLFRQR